MRETLVQSLGQEDQETLVQSLGQEDLLEKGQATHSSVDEDWLAPHARSSEGKWRVDPDGQIERPREGVSECPAGNRLGDPSPSPCSHTLRLPIAVAASVPRPGEGSAEMTTL